MIIEYDPDILQDCPCCGKRPKVRYRVEAVYINGRLSQDYTPYWTIYCTCRHKPKIGETYSFERAAEFWNGE